MGSMGGGLHPSSSTLQSMLGSPNHPHTVSFDNHMQSGSGQINDISRMSNFLPAIPISGRGS
jgi:hypothetical protein